MIPIIMEPIFYFKLILSRIISLFKSKITQKQKHLLVSFSILKIYIFNTHFAYILKQFDLTKLFS